MITGYRSRVIMASGSFSRRIEMKASTIRSYMNAINAATTEEALERVRDSIRAEDKDDDRTELLNRARLRMAIIKDGSVEQVDRDQARRFIWEADDIEILEEGG
jgi:hypothetical protein